MHLLIWITTALLLALWSAFAWGLHALLALDPAWVGDLKPLIDAIPYGELLNQWLPGWQALLHLGVDLTQIGLRWAGAAAPWLVAAMWGVGAVLLLGAAAVGSGVVIFLRRQSARPADPLLPPRAGMPHGR